MELPELGQGRLHRLLGLIESCPVSINDLSRVNALVRFNMPFELGIVVAMRHLLRSRALSFSKVNGFDCRER